MNLFFCGFGTLLAAVGELVSNIKTLNVNKLTSMLMFNSEVSKFFRASLLNNTRGQLLLLSLFY